MDSTFTKREIYEERVVKEHVTTITLGRHRITEDLQVARKDQVGRGTRATLEILVDTLSEVTIWPVFV
jgi:hypothetical protein